MWIWLLIYVLSIICVIFIENKNPTEALFWVVVMLCLPYVGLLLYLVLGSTVGIKLTKKIRTHRLEQGFRHASLEKLPEYESPLSAVLSSSDRQVAAFQKNFNNGNVRFMDSYQLLTDGQAHYKKLFEDIEAAKHTIFVEFYTLHNDQVGQKFVSLLAKKAGEGVCVYLIIDAIANVGTPQSLFRELRKQGGVVKRIKPYFTHFRSHRKIVVIDCNIGYIGGMNIGEQYVGLHKVKTPWRDTQIRFTGDCVLQLSKCYLEDLLCCLSQKELRKLPAKIFNIPTNFAYENAEPCQFVMGGADADNETIKLTYLSMIAAAKERIQIQSPYFIPDGSILDALKIAASTGVEIEIMVPKVKASFFLDPVTRYYCGNLLHLGVKVYQYHGYIHAKTMVIDDEICCIGSVNMDIRSLQVDDEICGIFYGNDLVAEHKEIFEQDTQKCSIYTQKDFEERSFSKRLAERIYLLFAPLM